MRFIGATFDFDPAVMGVLSTFLLAGFAMITTALAFYIRSTIRSATISINQLNGGSHLADLPNRMDLVEQKLDVCTAMATEARVTGRLVLKNQIEIMAHVMPPAKERNVHD